MSSRITVTALFMLVLGVVVMALSARPLQSWSIDGLSSFSWPIVVLPAVVLGVLFGLVIGLVARRRTARRGPVVAVVVCSVLALLPLGVPLGQLGGSDSTDPADLVAALAGWVLYQLLSAGLAIATARHDRTVGGGWDHVRGHDAGSS